MAKHLKSKGLAEKGNRITAHEVNESSSGQRCPVFSFEFLQPSYCISKCESVEKVAFTDQMRTLSQMTWMQIMFAPKSGLGSEKIPQHIIRAGIPSHITADITFLALRFYGKAEMVGYRENRIFHVLWFDRDFTLYKHD